MSTLQDTYRALVAHIEEKGMPPTYRELGKRLGLTSTDSVRERLISLERAGWIERVEGSPRAIRLVKPSGEPSARKTKGSGPTKARGVGSPEDDGVNYDEEEAN